MVLYRPCGFTFELVLGNTKLSSHAPCSVIELRDVFPKNRYSAAPVASGAAGYMFSLLHLFGDPAESATARRGLLAVGGDDALTARSVTGTRSDVAQA